MSFQQFKLTKSINQSRGIFDKFLYRPDNNDTIEDISADGYFADSRYIDDPEWINGVIEITIGDTYYVGNISDNGITVIVDSSLFVTPEDLETLDHFKYNPVTDKLEGDRPIETTLSTFFLGEQWGISSGGFQVFFTNFSNQIDYTYPYSGVKDQEDPANQDSSGLLPLVSSTPVTDLLELELEGPPAPSGAVQLSDGTVLTANIYGFAIEVIVEETINPDDYLFYELYEGPTNTGILAYRQKITGISKNVGDTFRWWFDNPVTGPAGQEVFEQMFIAKGSQDAPQNFLWVRPTLATPSKHYAKSIARVYEDKEVALTEDVAIYDGVYDTEAEILALDPTVEINKTYWARDTKAAYQALSSDITSSPVDVWQSLTMCYDADTDTFCTPQSQDGFNGDLNGEVIIPAVNIDVTGATELDPKVFASLGSTVGDEQFQSVIKVAAADIANAQVFGVNTTTANAGGKTKLTTFGKINSVNTSAWSLNDALYVDPNTAGNLTNVQPAVNARLVAQVLKVDATEGILFVNTISNQPLDSAFTPVGFDRFWLTGDAINLAGADFYEGLRSDQGTVPEATESVLVADNTKVGLTQDHVTVVFPTDREISQAEYRGQIEFQIDNTGAGEKLYYEVYHANPNGVPIDSGLVTQPVGDLGVKPIFTMQTALLDAQANTPFFAETVGAAEEDYLVPQGDRLRIHIVCEKVGTTGPSKTFTAYFGSDHLSFVDTPQRLSTDDIDNASTVDGATATAALDNVLQSGEVWVEGNHKKNKVYTENGWLGHPIVDTEDHLEPQTIGGAEDSVDTSTFPTASDISIVKMVHQFTITEDCFARALQVMTPRWDTDSVSKVTVFNITTGEASVVDNPILQSGVFTTLNVGSAIFLAGTQLEIWFEFYNAAAANQITGGWISNLAAGIPASTVFNIDNLTTPTAVEISHTDLDLVDRSTELDGVVSGSIIRFTETADVARNIEFTVDTVDTASGTSTKYTVLAGSINNGAKAIRSGQTCTVNIDVPITQPTEYGVKAGFYPTENPSWGTVTTELYYNGVQQAGTVDAYPINLICQKAFISPNWFYMSIPTAGSGGGGETPDFQEVYNVSNPPQIYIEDNKEIILRNDNIVDNESFLFSTTGTGFVRYFGVRGNSSVYHRAMTTAERDAELLNPFIGDTFYNYDRGVFETWDGGVWISPLVEKKLNNTGQAVILGDVVIQSVSADNAVTLTSTIANTNWPAVVVDGGANGTFITVARRGIHPVLIGAQVVNRGDRLTTGNAVKTGQLTNGAGVGVFGVAVEAGSSGSPQYILCEIGVNAELI